MEPIIKKHHGIKVLRDDFLTGGTKSILMPKLIKGGDEFVYASPVYGGFQIALSAYCEKVGKRATIFCAKRKEKHPNTLKCLQYGAQVIEIDYGYLSVIERRAKDYCDETGAVKLKFGAQTVDNVFEIGQRVRKVIDILNGEPEEIWCAIGSGTLVSAILMATNTAKVYGVQVGADFKSNNPRLTVMKYHRDFSYESKFKAEFPSMANYDLKAFEYCMEHKKSNNVLFWNVL